jgi:hypothetical protein
MVKSTLALASAGVFIQELLLTVNIKEILLVTFKYYHIIDGVLISLSSKPFATVAF